MTKPRRFRPAALVRVVRKKTAQPVRMVAYDFETTRIAKGTPRPLYLTAFGLDPAFSLDTPIRDMTHLRLLLEAHFLTDDLIGTRYVAWNANAFDAYFVAAALLESPDWVIRPYLTKGNSLRGLRVIKAEDAGQDQAKGWEFLDGMAMLGLAGTPLSKLLDTFAPDFRKLSGTIDFDREEFDPQTPHIKPTHSATLKGSGTQWIAPRASCWTTSTNP